MLKHHAIFLRRISINAVGLARHRSVPCIRTAPRVGSNQPRHAAQKARISPTRTIPIRTKDLALPHGEIGVADGPPPTLRRARASGVASGRSSAAMSRGAQKSFHSPSISSATGRGAGAGQARQRG